MDFLKKLFSFTDNLDPVILAVISILAVWGIFIVYSATGADPDFLQRKIIQVAVGLVLLVVVANVKISWIDRLSFPLLVFTVVLLALTLVIGETSKGSTRWINIGGFLRFQPSEIAKIAVPLYLCVFLGSKQSVKLSYRLLIYAGAITLVPTLLVQLEPDLGTSILIFASGMIVIFLAGLSWKLLTAGAVFLAGLIPLMWMFWMKPYQKVRVLTILDPEKDPLGSGYHVIQSKIAIGSGGISGKGLMQGTQVQLNFIPEAHTDFIYSVLSEELGLIGVTALFLLYLALVLRMFYLAATTENSTSRLLTASQFFIFSIYVFVNIGMVSGLLPVVGVTLPLISYGGTSFVSLCLTFGLVMAYHQQSKKNKTIFNNH